MLFSLGGGILSLRSRMTGRREGEGEEGRVKREEGRVKSEGGRVKREE